MSLCHLRVFEFEAFISLLPLGDQPTLLPALFNIPPEHQKLVVHAVVWAMKHSERNIADTGLEILHELLQNVGRTPNVAQGFYQQYLLSLIQDVFAVMTDRLHKSGFKMHATLLRVMFHLVQMNQVTVPLFDPSTQPPGQTNPIFLVTTLVICCCKVSQILPKFKLQNSWKVCLTSRWISQRSRHIFETF